MTREQIHLLASLLVLLPAHSGAAPDDDRPRRGRIERIAHQYPAMVTVPAGAFPMGMTEKEREDYLEACEAEMNASDYVCQEDWFGMRKMTQRMVDLDAFQIDRYEVTGAEYRACAAAGGCDIAALVDGDERYLEDHLPMVNVTWQDAVDYCAWMGKRLPTEAEWEKAARGEQGRRWPWGNHDRKDGSNHGKIESEAMVRTHGLLPRKHNRFARLAAEYVPDGSDGHLYAAPPGSYIWGTGPYDTYDMAGNVSEWVQDFFGAGDFSDLPLQNPMRAKPTELANRTERGGSWAEPKLHGRTYHRRPGNPDRRSPWRGFRCARSLD